MSRNIKHEPADESGKTFQRSTRYIGGIKENFHIAEADNTAGLIKLPEVNLPSDLSFYNCLKMRRSIRDYTGEPVTEIELSQVLRAAQGVSITRGDRHLCTAPSAGALYPVDTYIALFDVDGIPKGLAKYIADNHALQWVYRTDEDLRAGFYDACLQQGMVLNSSVLVIWIADFNRCVWRYGQRAYRYVYLDAGHMAQNLLLACAGLGLGACPIGAYFDDRIDNLCGLDDETRTVIYCATIGKITDK